MISNILNLAPMMQEKVQKEQLPGEPGNWVRYAPEPVRDLNKFSYQLVKPVYVWISKRFEPRSTSTIVSQHTCVGLKDR